MIYSLRAWYFGFMPFTAYGPDSRPPMAIFELLDYIVNEVSLLVLVTHAGLLCTNISEKFDAII